MPSPLRLDQSEARRRNATSCASKRSAYRSRFFPDPLYVSRYVSRRSCVHRRQRLIGPNEMIVRTLPSEAELKMFKTIQTGSATRLTCRRVPMPTPPTPLPSMLPRDAPTTWLPSSSSSLSCHSCGWHAEAQWGSVTGQEDAKMPAVLKSSPTSAPASNMNACNYMQARPHSDVIIRHSRGARPMICEVVSETLPTSKSSL